VDPRPVFAILSFLFSAGAYVPYVKAVLVSNARPTISTWISWGVMDAALLAGMIAADEMAWQLVSYIGGVGFVIAASVYKGATLGWTRLDSVCISLVFMAVGLWTLSGNPNIAIMTSAIATTIGTIPMVRNIWHNPTREPILPWILVVIGGGFGVSAVRSWTIAAALGPVCFFILQIIIVVLISRKFYFHKTLA
jgi:hypothetical protein